MDAEVYSGPEEANTASRSLHYPVDGSTVTDITVKCCIMVPSCMHCVLEAEHYFTSCFFAQCKPVRLYGTLFQWFLAA